MKVDYDLYKDKDSCSVNKGHYVESNEIVSPCLMTTQHIGDAD